MLHAQNELSMPEMRPPGAAEPEPLDLKVSWMASPRIFKQQDPHSLNQPLLPRRSLRTLPIDAQRRNTTPSWLGDVAGCSLAGMSSFFATTSFKSLTSKKTRSTVKTLIDRVPGGLATGFRTYDEAVEDYNDAKARGFVRLERERGDDLVFGPRSQGVM